MTNYIGTNANNVIAPRDPADDYMDGRAGNDTISRLYLDLNT